jgi:hypothetical protein
MFEPPLWSKTKKSEIKVQKHKDAALFPVPLSQRLSSCATKVFKKAKLLLQLMLASLF